MVIKALGKEVQVLVEKIVPLKEKTLKQHFAGILVGEDYALATDGRILLQVPLTTVEAKDLPKDTLYGINKVKPAWISREHLVNAFRNLPTNKFLSKLKNVFIRETEKETILMTTDGEYTTKTSRNKIEEEVNLSEYPDVSKLSKLQTPVLSITLGAGYLKALSEYVLKLGLNKSINFIFQGEEKGVGIYFRTENGMCKGVLMPMRKEYSLHENVDIFNKIVFKEK